MLLGWKKKKVCNLRYRPYLLDGAQEKTRTSTVLPPPAPEAGASTNFATWAQASILVQISVALQAIRNFFVFRTLFFKVTKQALNSVLPRNVFCHNGVYKKVRVLLKI
jgi:hypothetical protein